MSANVPIPRALRATVASFLILTSCGGGDPSAESADPSAAVDEEGATRTESAGPTIEIDGSSGRIPQAEGMVTAAVESDGAIVLNLEYAVDGSASLRTLDPDGATPLPAEQTYSASATEESELTTTPDGGYVAVSESETVFSTGVRGPGTGTHPVRLVATASTLVAVAFDPANEQRLQLMVSDFDARGIDGWRVVLDGIDWVDALAVNGDRVVAVTRDGIRQSEDAGHTWSDLLEQRLGEECDLVDLLAQDDGSWMAVCGDGRISVGPIGEWTMIELDLPLTKLAPDAHPLAGTDLASTNATAYVVAAAPSDNGAFLVVREDGFELPDGGGIQPGELQVALISNDGTVVHRLFVLEDDGTGLPYLSTDVIKLSNGHLFVTSAFENGDQTHGDTAWVVVER